MPVQSMAGWCAAEAQGMFLSRMFLDSRICLVLVLWSGAAQGYSGGLARCCPRGTCTLLSLECTYYQMQGMTRLSPCCAELRLIDWQAGRTWIEMDQVSCATTAVGSNRVIQWDASSDSMLHCHSVCACTTESSVVCGAIPFHLCSLHGLVCLWRGAGFAPRMGLRHAWLRACYMRMPALASL